MLVPFFRTVILYVFIIVAFRLMGKRQVAEMQAVEFVITILISAVASVPMQDLDIPLMHGIVPIFTLISAEILISVLSLHSMKIRKLFSGAPVQIVNKGIIDQKALRKVRMTLDDLFESLRLKDIFDIRKVEFAQVETNGQISILLSPESEPVTPETLQIVAPIKDPLELIVSDGVLFPKNLQLIGRNQQWLQETLSHNGAQGVGDVFLLCADRGGSILFYRKER